MQANDEKKFETQVDRILQSEELRSSDVLRRLLRFLADKSVSGEADSLKEYIVAIEGLGKPSSYDPRQNSAVRIQAARLRQKLSEYYRTEGKDDDVLIDLPKGRFKLTFEQRLLPESPAEAPQPARRTPSRSTIAHEFHDTPHSRGRFFWLPWVLALLAACSASFFAIRAYEANERAAFIYNQWNPALEEIWSPVLSSKRPTLMVIEDPLFVQLGGASGMYFRDRSLNEWRSATTSTQITAIQKALGGADVQPSRYYTAFGEVDASMLLSRLLAPRVPGLSMIKSSQLSWRQLADNNILFIGVQNLFFSEQLQGLPLKPKLIPELEGVRNLQPQPGEPALFADGFQTAPSESGTAYALVTRLPGPVGNNDIQSFTSNRSAGYVAAIQAFTDPRSADALTARLKKTYGHMPRFYQVLYKVDFKDDVPTGTTIVLSRELN